MIGVQQKLNLNIDLRDVPEVPGLNVGILIDNSSKKEPPKSTPIAVDFLDNKMRWHLKVGSVNNLTLHKWQWSRIGIGTIFILLLMIFSMILQYLKLQMGLGFPELPP